MTVHVDIRAMYQAIDAARTARDLTWSQVAQQAGVSASTLSRIGHGKRPDIDGFAALVGWLGVSADTFIPVVSAAPELEVQIALVLAAQPDLLESDRRFLHEVLAASIKRIREDQRNHA